MLVRTTTVILAILVATAAGVTGMRLFLVSLPEPAPRPRAMGETVPGAGYINDIVSVTTDRVETPPVPIPVKLEPPMTATVEPTTVPVAEPAPQAAVAPIRQKITVDSLAQRDQYPLSGWTVTSFAGGGLASVELNDVETKPGSAITAQPGQVLLARGWAGDPSLGVRLPHVILALCDTVVASVAVSLPRPDIAKEIHPNLDNSGWQANLFSGDLPRCDNPTLRAYGVAPMRRMVFPLSGEFTVKFDDNASAPPFDVHAGTSSVRPEEIPETAPSATLSLKGAGANLRRCGNPKCEILGTLPAGMHVVAVLDRSAEWMLIASPAGSGWLARRLVTALSAEDSRVR